MTIRNVVDLTRLGLVALFMAPLAWGQSPRIQMTALDKLSSQASEVVDITLDGSTLRLGLQFMDKDPEARAALQGVTGVYVKVFQFDQPGKYASADLDGVRAQLEGPGWSRIVTVKKKRDGDVGIYLLSDAAGNTLGMTILALQPKELALVNLVGSLDLKRLGALEGKLGIPRLSGGKGSHGKTGGQNE